MFDRAPKVTPLSVTLLLLVSLTGIGNAQEPHATGRQPQPFQRFAVPPSAPVRFLLSARGRELLRPSPTPQPPRTRRGLGDPSPDLQTAVAPSQISPTAATVGTTCGTSGTKFSREGTTDALPQNEESL